MSCEPKTACRFGARMSGRRSRRCWNDFAVSRPEERRQVPALINGLAKLQLGAGDVAHGAADIRRGGRRSPDTAAKAEARFNAYRALEEQKWDIALVALVEAAKLDGSRFGCSRSDAIGRNAFLGLAGSERRSIAAISTSMKTW